MRTYSEVCQQCVQAKQWTILRWSTRDSPPPTVLARTWTSPCQRLRASWQPRPHQGPPLAGRGGAPCQRQGKEQAGEHERAPGRRRAPLGHDQPQSSHTSCQARWAHSCIAEHCTRESLASCAIILSSQDRSTAQICYRPAQGSLHKQTWARTRNTSTNTSLQSQAAAYA